MHISAIFMPLFALLAGAVGFYLRLMELFNAFEESGLSKRGAPNTIALIAFSAAFLIIILVFTVRVALKHKAPRGFENAFGTDLLSYPLMFSFVGIIWLGATVYHYFALSAAGGVPHIEWVFLILSAISAVSVTFFAVEMYQDPRRKISVALSAVPTLFMCFWLILLYRENATNPVLLSYCYQCLAVITSALGFYFTSGFIYNKPAPGKAVFCYFSAIYFCFITLADKHTISIRLIFAAIIAVNIVYVSMLIRNLRWKES